MRTHRLVFSLALGLTVAASASAEEIIYFSNGSSMPVRGHVVEGDMIKVDLGNDGFMAFPSSVVDRIVPADGDVVLGPSRSNVIDSGTRVYAQPAPVRESWALPEEVQSPSPVVTDSKGVAVIPVFPGATHPGKAKMMSANTLGAGVIDSATQGRAATQRRGLGSVIADDPTTLAQPRRKLSGIGFKR